MTQRLINTDKCLYLMEHRSDGTGQRLFALDDCTDTLGDPFVDVRIARVAYHRFAHDRPSVEPSPVAGFAAPPCYDCARYGAKI